MADDHTQRPTRASQPPLRGAPGTASGNDPLAELARLIGQNDPFAEFGRDEGRAPARAPEPAGYGQAAGPDMRHDERYAAAPGYADERYTAAPEQTAPLPPSEAYAQPYAQQGFAEPAYAPTDPYAPGVIPGHSGYEQGPYYPNNPHSTADDSDFYDDVAPRRRLGILAIAAVFALAVIGTAGAFGYRALFGSSDHSGPPPVIKADATPSKIVPATTSKDAKSGKLIYDRVNNGGQNEKLVSREEAPVDIKDKPVGTVLPQNQNDATPDAIQPMLGSGVIGVEPKKVHTIAIHPDQPASAASSAPTPAPALEPARAKPAAAVPPPQTAVEPATHRTVVARAEPVHHEAVPSNAPLSLNPNAVETPARPTQHVMHTAQVMQPTQIAPPRAAPAGSGYAVQIVSRHSEADAQASFHSLQAKYPQELGGHTPMIRRVDLGAKGVYYRAMVGPMSGEQASHLCSSLKAAGGACIVQKI
jgi:SPOR domain